MELGELLTTLSLRDVAQVTFGKEDITELLEFFIENNISYSVLDDHDNDLNAIVREIRQDTDEMDLEDIADWLEDIEDTYAVMMNEEVLTQNFDIKGSQVAVHLNEEC